MLTADFTVKVFALLIVWALIYSWVYQLALQLKGNG